ncbi:hypothetical protein L9F63_019749 [Diploptera punctata]|uniref:Glucose-methanol-choline oxidoreductase N-terminal domain-containing protein n=1 Tax=Diploptera punctata TaxID=6984 RepID=A0AAD8EEC4_DIPPU|nr:hypothetical protein L9F63_019749 [Diploptera punctata]
MVGVMVGLVVWSSWSSSQRGVIQIPKPHYDYIIGTSGCVLAGKLSAVPRNSVLLVEAGDHFSWLSSIPLATPVLQGSAQDWAFRTRTQIHSSWGLHNQSSAYPRGRGLGGSGQLNYLVHYPGCESDFVRWEEGGVTGWKYEQIRPYMMRMLGVEYNCSCLNNYRSILMAAAGHHHCQTIKVKDRPIMHVSEVDDDSELGKAFLKAGEELSSIFEAVKFSTVKSTIFKGQRWSSLDGYLRPALGRPNLHVLLNTQVNKVVIDDQRRVQGVELRKYNDFTTRLIRSNHEVILSAGAINTPHILLQSGVGPRDQLEKLGIPVVSDLHVGHNLHDHLNMPLYVSIESPVSVTLDKVQQLGQLWDYMIRGKGLLSSSGIVGVGTAEPDIGIVLFGLGSADEKLLQDIANYKQETFRALFPFSNNSSQEGFVLLATCLQPSSRGTVTLNDTEPTSRPVIDPQYLSQSKDIHCMIRAVQLAIQLATSTPFKQLGAKIHLPKLEECHHLEADAENTAYLECIIRTAAITGYHPGGTCKMGSPSDHTAVTDPLLRVRGFNGLRIMDASILPTPLSGHPNSVLIAMADRAADLILQH